MPVNSYRDLEVWRRSMLLAESIYSIVRQFPVDERYGLSSQLRRAAVSIPSNIAEGKGYGITGRYVHHLRIARGSEAELETQLELAKQLKLATAEQINPLLGQSSEVGRMLNGLIASLERQPNS